MTRGSTKRRRGLVAVLIAVVTVGSVLGATAGTSSAAPRSREHIKLWKLCPRAESNPSFLIVNVTDDPGKNTDYKSYGAETITAHIVRGGKAPAVDLDGDGVPEGDNPVLATVTLEPGDWQLVQVSGPWVGPHYVYFTALYRDHVRVMRGRQFCHCESDVPESTTTTLPPTTPTTTPDS